MINMEAYRGGLSCVQWGMFSAVGDIMINVEVLSAAEGYCDKHGGLSC